MELRQLTSEYERQIFAKCLVKARATSGFGFRETTSSQLGNAHLMFGNLYALFHNKGEPPEGMVGGFIIHDLATLPQSYPQPDLSHLPPRSVIEGGEWWSLCSGVGRIAGLAAAAVAGLLQAKAILLYPIVKPVDLAAQHARFNFVNACEPVRFPYGETVEGGEIWVQPMTLEGENLERYIRSGFDFLFGAGDRRSFRFDIASATRPPDLRASIRGSADGEPKNLVVPSGQQADERNGTVSA